MPNTYTDKILKLAEEMSAAFTNGPRESTDTGRTIRVLKDDAPGWMTDVVREAHDGMLPDDFRYEMIEEALDTLVRAEGDDEQAQEDLPEPPIYNAERLRWLASHLERVGYCDEVCEESGVEASVGILDRIAIGYRAEQEDVLALVVRALAALVDDAAE